MIKNSFFALITCIFLFASCTDEMPGPVMPGDANSPIVLDCDIANSLTLTNQNTDGVDYIIDCNLTILGDVVIEAGTSIQVNNGLNIEVTNEGSFAANGTADLPVTIQGAQGGTAATWNYLLFKTTNAKNKLNHVIINNGGSDGSWTSLVEGPSAVYVQGRLAMTNTTIQYSNGNGVTVSDVISPPNITEFSNNIFRNCTQYPISVPPSYAKDLNLASCIFTDNGKQFVKITDANGGDRLEVESTWANAPIPYFVDFDLDLYASLTIEAGSELVFGSGGSISTISAEDTFLKINGTASNHVIMRGEVATAGAWAGLYITSSNAQNEFNYLDISDGGQEPLSFSDFRGNIALEEENARLTLNDCTSARADCDVIISTFFGSDYTFINNSPSITNICED